MFYHLFQIRLRRFRRTGIHNVLAILTTVVAALALYVSWGRIHPLVTVEHVTWSLFLTGIVVGAFTTGWRVAQLPKTRTAEFYLVTPSSDLSIVGAEIFSGMVRLAAVILPALPVIAFLCGYQWLTLSGATTILAVTITGGWLSGMILAAVAYEPLWVRKLLERLFFAGIVAYLVLWGLFGDTFLPWFAREWTAVTGLSPRVLFDATAFTRHINPFQLLGSVSGSSETVSWSRFFIVEALLLFACSLCIWRISRRLRTHYLEENYSSLPHSSQASGQIKDNPLAWWTRQRVGRFRGRINLYLIWATILLYAGRMLLADNWPSFLAVNQLNTLHRFGGAGVLLAACLQLVIVSLAFLSGLWDSTSELRALRMELLLTTPLTPRQYLWASVVATWTRGKGYLAAAGVLLLTALLAKAVTVPYAVAILMVASIYLSLAFTIAFRNFSKLSSDQHVTAHGIAWSILPVLIAIVLWKLEMPYAAASTPLGAIYALYNLGTSSLLDNPEVLMRVVVATQACYALFAIWHFRQGKAEFDSNMRHWLSEHFSAR